MSGYTKFVTFPPDYLQNFQKLHLQQKVITAQQLPTQNLAELILNSPDAALNGQGGMLQMYSIRGLSRWRVKTLVEGVPINTDRRAGSAASFVPPAFVQQLQLIPGAASSIFGSGALGGAVNVNLQKTEGYRGRFSTDTNQDSSNVSFTSSDKANDLGISYRQAQMGEDANGEPLNDGFEHLAGLWRHRKSSGILRDAWLFISEGNNWGKSSSRFPQDRRTYYPENNHAVFKTQVFTNNILIEPYFHRSHLQTNIERNDSLTLSENDALNYGITALGQKQFTDWQYSWQVGMHERNDVLAKETLLDNQQFLLQSRTTLSGDERELFFQSDIYKRWDELNWTSGIRLSHTDLQDRQSSAKKIDVNWSAYSGLLWQIGSNWATSGYISTAYRTPSLTELFFSGETPRGQVLGDRNLKSENALNIEYDVKYKVKTVQLILRGFYQQIDNYIERIELDNDILRYQNLERADIKGISYSLNYTAIKEKLHVNLFGQWLSGEDNNDNPLIDVSPNHHTISLLYNLEKIKLRADIRHRSSKKNVAPGEQPLPELTTIAIAMEGQLNANWGYRLTMNNLSNKLARTSTDEYAPYIRGRHGVLELYFSF